MNFKNGMNQLLESIFKNIEIAAVIKLIEEEQRAKAEEGQQRQQSAKGKSGKERQELRQEICCITEISSHYKTGQH